MESVIVDLLDKVHVKMPTQNFAEFMIFMAKRKKSENKIKEIFLVNLI